MEAITTNFNKMTSKCFLSFDVSKSINLLTATTKLLRGSDKDKLQTPNSKSQKSDIQTTGGKRSGDLSINDVVTMLENFDFGPREELLYLRPVSDSIQILNTSIAPGEPTLSPMRYTQSFENKLSDAQVIPMPLSEGKSVCPPLDEDKLRRKLARLRSKDYLESWFDLKRQPMTSELLQDIQILNLRGFAHRNKFYKSTANTSSATFPSHFHVARVINGGLCQPIGENLRLPSSDLFSGRKKRGKTLTQELIKDRSVVNWIDKRSDKAKRFESSGDRNWYNKKRKLQKSNSK